MQVEIADLFMNLLHFMNDDGQLVRMLTGFGVGEVIIAVFGVEEEHLKEDTLLWAVNTLVIMLSQNPREIRRLVVEHDRVLKIACDRWPHCAGAIENLVESVQHQDEESCPL